MCYLQKHRFELDPTCVSSAWGHIMQLPWSLVTATMTETSQQSVGCVTRLGRPQKAKSFAKSSNTLLSLGHGSVVLME